MYTAEYGKLVGYLISIYYTIAVVRLEAGGVFFNIFILLLFILPNIPPTLDPSLVPKTVSGSSKRVDKRSVNDDR